MATDAADLVEKDDLLGRTIGKYTLARVIGVGGMGRVYEGVHETLGKRFALKFIDPETATSDAIQRFQREAQAASAVESAHIVDIFDVGTSDDGRPYIVMELMRGEDLGHRIRRLGRLEIVESLKITAQVLRGLARAHDAGIVHRDLKPDNVFLVERDDDPCFAKVLDFGVSKIQRRDTVTKTITREGVVLGTPVYMSPEQAQAHPDVDARTDLWAVGAILYECLTGSPPFAGATYEAVIVAICTRDPADVREHAPDVPEGVARVLKKTLSREKNDRYASARDLLDALVAESEGLLPTSMKSDSLKRAIIRPPSSGGSTKGPMTLAAVSTVAATPAPTGGATTQVSGVKRTYLAVGAIAIGIGGVAAGIWYANRGDNEQADNTGQRQVILVQAPGATTTVVVSVSVPAPAISPSPAPSESVSSAASASAGASASAIVSPRPVVPPRTRPTAVRSAEPTAPKTGELKIKPP